MNRSASFVIITAFLSAIIIGTFLLRLPEATTRGSIAFEDAMFTATSAVTVTGLIVKDTPRDYTLFGQIVILVLLQFGGLGYMTLSTLMILLIGKNLSLKEQYIIENDFTGGGHRNIKELIQKIFLMTFSLEFTGAVSFFLQFSQLTPGKRVFASVFHSISAFCNAGFSVFSDNFEQYTGHIGINFTLMLLIICGGLGFLVLDEILLFFKGKIKKFSKFSLHSKLVIISTTIFISTGFLILLLQELVNKSNTLPFGHNVLAALFHSVAARTAGFNTINLNLYSTASIYILIILMMIGASPGSTGGGVKTTSICVVFAYIRSRLSGRQTADIYYREIPVQYVERSFMMILLAILLVSFSSLLLLNFDGHLGLKKILFETVSAFGTVGLSLGVTAKLSLPSKIVLIMTMFIGRVGLFTLLFALSKRESKAVYRYPEANIMVG